MRKTDSINKRSCRTAVLISFFIPVLFSCQSPDQKSSVAVDPLASWNDGQVKTSILKFVEEAKRQGGDGFIPAADRIAVFDNDGTLWSEQPLYFQLFFTLDRVKEMAPKHPEWADEPIFKAVLENDMKSLKESGLHGLIQLVMASHANMTSEEFETIVHDWIKQAKHPRFNRPFTDLIYQPMLELIRYLEENDFKVFIVSGGGIEFMRPWVEEVYGISKDHVVGSSIKTEYKNEGGNPVINRLAEIDFIDDGEGKPVAINKHIGRKPVFSAGNSDGDLAMMQWTASGEGPRFMLYVHHTDSIREWAYDRKSYVGKLDKGLKAAADQNWEVIDMARDWKVIYPFEE